MAVNFDWLREYLLSSDLSRVDELDQDGSNEAKLLDLSVKLTESGNRVSLQSYPRSGNTFLRSLLEKVTGVFTGSDMDGKMTFTLA